MTLERLLFAISEMAINQKIIRSSAAGADIYALNTKTIKDWPMLFSSPTGNHTVKESTTEFTITLYYFERLLSDSENEVGILSVSIEELKNIVRGIDKIDGVVGVSDEYQITNFVETESFSDRVCGSYTTIIVEVVNDVVCFEE